MGAFALQDLNAADEFADNEDPAHYSINVLGVKLDTIVNWTNNDSTMHIVTAVDRSFDSSFLGEAKSWSQTFDTVGEFECFCMPHSVDAGDGDRRGLNRRVNNRAVW